MKLKRLFIKNPLVVKQMWGPGFMTRYISGVRMKIIFTRGFPHAAIICWFGVVGLLLLLFYYFNQNWHFTLITCDELVCLLM